MVIAVWSLLPLALSIRLALDRAAHGAIIFGVIALGSLTAAALASSRRPNAQLAAVALLTALFLAVAVQTARHFLLASGPGALAVADSPLGYLTGIMLECFFAVFLGAFAVGVWRRRTRRRTASPV